VTRLRFLYDRSLLLVLLLAAVIVFPRSALIASAHSESIDDEYHLVRGVRYMLGNLKKSPLNDPTLGQTIMALPLWLSGAHPYGDGGRSPTKYGLILHKQSVLPEVLLMSVAMLKAALFVPFVAFCFAWMRRLYNARAAWTAAIILLIEPTITAHLVPAGLDVLGFEAIVLGCWTWWRYFARPTWASLAIAAATSGAAMLIKHTAIIMPAVALGYAILFCLYRRREGQSIGGWIRARWIHAIAAAVIAFVSINLLCGDFVKIPRPGWVKPGTYVSKIFDIKWPGGFVEVPRPDSIKPDSFLGKLYNHAWPAGRYVRSLKTAMYHGEVGHSSWFMGRRNDKGTWKYYPVVATYKVPIGLLAFIAIGGLSLIVVRPRFEEWALVVPMVLLAGLITTGGINIGFRHAIPVLGLLLLLSTRALLIDGKWMLALVAGLLVITTFDVTRWAPNYISYLNWPRTRVWMQINDSNLDWGQGLKQIRQWIDTNNRRKIYRDRPIYVRAFGLDYSPAIAYYLGDRAIRVPRNGPVPRSGILIVSPVYTVGLFDKEGLYDFLRDKDPIEIIGDGSNLVFDLDALNGKKPKKPKPAVRPATTQATER
jgi:hypothetical protein